MRKRICCFTGHRELPFFCRKEIAAKLEKTIIELIGRGVQFYGAGGALGFDTLAAQTVLKLKKVPGHQIDPGTPLPDPNARMADQGCGGI